MAIGWREVGRFDRDIDDTQRKAPFERAYPDRGSDVFASPDGLGLEEPRIFVEVKHRPRSTMGADEIRAFLGGRRPGDRCLYVSTGGFTKEARYKAERATVPIRLVGMTDLDRPAGDANPVLRENGRGSAGAGAFTAPVLAYRLTGYGHISSETLSLNS